MGVLCTGLTDPFQGKHVGVEPRGRIREREILTPAPPQIPLVNGLPTRSLVEKVSRRMARGPLHPGRTRGCLEDAVRYGAGQEAPDWNWNFRDPVLGCKYIQVRPWVQARWRAPSGSVPPHCEEPFAVSTGVH